MTVKKINGKNNRARGFEVEREVVKKINNRAAELVKADVYTSPPFVAYRMWGSNGRSRGFAEEVDVFMEDCNSSGGGISFQCKRQKKLPQYLFPQALKKRTEFDALIMREDGDRDAHLIVMNLDYFIHTYLK